MFAVQRIQMLVYKEGYYLFMILQKQLRDYNYRHKRHSLLFIWVHILIKQEHFNLEVWELQILTQLLEKVNKQWTY